MFLYCAKSLSSFQTKLEFYVPKIALKLGQIPCYSSGVFGQILPKSLGIFSNAYTFPYAV